MLTERQPRLCPTARPAAQDNRLPKAEIEHELLRVNALARAGATGTVCVDDDHAGMRQFIRRTHAELIKRDVIRAGDVLPGKFYTLAHVQQQHLLAVGQRVV